MSSRARRLTVASATSVTPWIEAITDGSVPASGRRAATIVSGGAVPAAAGVERIWAIRSTSPGSPVMASVRRTWSKATTERASMKRTVGMPASSAWAAGSGTGSSSHAQS